MKCTSADLLLIFFFLLFASFLPFVLQLQTRVTRPTFASFVAAGTRHGEVSPVTPEPTFAKLGSPTVP